jgi:hypothetical protein
MRKVNVLEFVSLDGVIQAPGGPEEDTSGGFAYGGWISPHSDPVLSTAIRKQMNMPFDLLIGRFGRAALALDLAGITNTVGAPFLRVFCEGRESEMPAPSGFDHVSTTKSNSTRSIATHPCKKTQGNHRIPSGMLTLSRNSPIVVMVLPFGLLVSGRNAGSHCHHRAPVSLSPICQLQVYAIQTEADSDQQKP